MMTSIAKRQWAVRSGLSQAVVMASSCTDNTKAPAEDIWELAFRNTVEVANWLWCLRLERQLERRCEASEMVHLLWMRSCIERLALDVLSLSILSVDRKYSQRADVQGTI